MKHLFSLFVAAFATGIAFAFHSPQEPEERLFAKSEGQWVEITGQQLGTDYHCVSSSQVCTARFENDVPIEEEMIPESRVNGAYTPAP
ncbi:DUF6520 family protein [Rapidithrix thailandica]|uniref:DUF6520 family protein n=1 Tax=Rapidithrix thailandica TaxID=413964 RepID=A0AAW9S368_9BACT